MSNHHLLTTIQELDTTHKQNKKSASSSLHQNHLYMSRTLYFQFWKNKSSLCLFCGIHLSYLMSTQCSKLVSMANGESFLRLNLQLQSPIWWPAFSTAYCKVFITLCLKALDFIEISIKCIDTQSFSPVMNYTFSLGCMSFEMLHEF